MVDAQQREVLLEVARGSIRDAVGIARVTAPAGEQLCGVLGEPGASFVTLTIEGRLRGCIGSLVPSRPLASDVWDNARRTALDDPRFAPLAPPETASARLAISVLGPLETLEVTDETELLAVLEPGVDGLLIGIGQRRATFLPKVWDSLPQPEDFLRQLKRKMGVADDFWAESMRVQRYRTEEFGGSLLLDRH